MKRVALIVTGQAELRALHHSLERQFEGVKFVPEFGDSFTSTALPAEPLLNPQRPTLVEKLATRLVAAVDPGRTGEPADLAVLVDDLELVNTAAPERVVHHLRAAVRAHLEARWPSAERRARCARLVRERCSFHLFAPMLEAYFFAEPEALRRAGAKKDASLPAGRDVEDFETSDPEYLAACAARAPGTGGGVAIPGTQNPARHPKRYLQFLCDPQGHQPRAYQETKGGCDALRTLDWPVVMTAPENVRFGRALLVDLAHGLERDDLARQWRGGTHPLTSSEGPDLILRNL